MNTMLRNLARKWASALLVSEANELRNKLVTTEAAYLREKATADGAVRMLLDANVKIRQLSEDWATCNRHKQQITKQRDVALSQLAVSCEALEAQADAVDEHAAQAIRAMSGQSATLPEAGLLHPHRPSHRQDTP